MFYQSIFFLLLFNVYLHKCFSVTNSDEPSGTALSSTINDKKLLNHNNTDNRKIIFLNNATKCQMYHKKCFVKIILTDPNLISSIKAKSLSRKTFEFKSMEKCSLFNASTLSKECVEFKNYTRLYSIQQFFLLRLKPRLVGIKYLELEYLTGESDDYLAHSLVKQLHKIVITRPERFIDTFQLIYIVFFSTLIAIVMGILLDLDALFKIVKMPIPVLIGFVSQYLFMPLVFIICFIIILNHF